MSSDAPVSGGADLTVVAAALRRGEVVILPTDTIYGLVAAADDSAAVERMFAEKQRPADVRVAVLVADVEQARRYVLLGEAGEALAAACWPGPLTIVAPRHAPGSLAAGDDDTLGVRCPDDDRLRALAAAVGPLAATSANRHGRETAATAEGVASDFPGLLVVDGGPRVASASTVISVVDHPVQVLREGPIARTDIEAILTAGS
ncbi:MAG: L-threonylcarbamoyladenylate synthase [Acidimicrobiales bacterium]